MKVKAVTEIYMESKKSIKIRLMRKDKQPPRSKKYYRSTKSGAGMTKAGVADTEEKTPDQNLKLL